VLASSRRKKSSAARIARGRGYHVGNPLLDLDARAPGHEELTLGDQVASPQCAAFGDTRTRAALRRAITCAGKPVGVSRSIRAMRSSSVGPAAISGPKTVATS